MYWINTSYYIWMVVIRVPDNFLFWWSYFPSEYTWRILRISHERHIFEYLSSWIQNFNKKISNYNEIALFTSDNPVSCKRREILFLCLILKFVESLEKKIGFPLIKSNSQYIVVVSFILWRSHEYVTVDIKKPYLWSRDLIVLMREIFSCYTKKYNIFILNHLFWD